MRADHSRVLRAGPPTAAGAEPETLRMQAVVQDAHDRERPKVALEPAHESGSFAVGGVGLAAAATPTALQATSLCAARMMARVAASLLPRHAPRAFAAEDGLQLSPIVGGGALIARRAEVGRARVISRVAVSVSAAVDAAGVSLPTVSIAGAAAPAGPHVCSPCSVAGT